MPRDARSTMAVTPATAALGLALAACAASAPRFPWLNPATAPSSSPSGHAEVVTVSTGYRRASAQVLVRAIGRPTRANLDYAAYHANFMNADPAPERPLDSGGRRPDTGRAFAGALAPETLTGSIAATPLTEAERRHPLAVAPLVELLVSRHVPGGARLEDVSARIRAEDFGLGGGPQLTRQTATEMYRHDPGGSRPPEIWIKVEFAPWFTGFSAMPDEDGDGFPEIYGRVAAPAAASLADATALEHFIADEYAGRTLSPAEIKAWAHQLASYWYPSYNTDLVAAGDSWPDGDTEAAIRAELGGQRFAHPAVVMRGKPQGKPVYNVFLIGDASSVGPAPTSTSTSTSPTPGTAALARSQPTADPQPVATAIRAELGAHGGSWARWAQEVAPQHAAIKRRLKAEPATTKATAGVDGFLFFRQSLAYVVGGDLGKQRGDKNPLPAILGFQRLLAAHGVDFLFVPVPTKVEIFPDKLGLAAPAAGGAGSIVNPFERKFLLELADSGVEVVDLLPLFLRERTAPASSPPAPLLYQRQDTHWTSRGLELAARAVAERVKRYPWYTAPARGLTYRTKDAEFTRHGDLYSRLPERDKPRFAPETQVGHQVISPAGALYEDDDASPIVLLGDSFTGVFQLMDCEHAGVSAHLAKELGRPVDLVMSYGGGPNVRHKLLRRGIGALATKKLVIWMMTARDLYDFWEGWQALAPPPP